LVQGYNGPPTLQNITNILKNALLMKEEITEQQLAIGEPFEIWQIIPFMNVYPIKLGIKRFE
jgi:hypothetical protein